MCLLKKKMVFAVVVVVMMSCIIGGVVVVKASSSSGLGKKGKKNVFGCISPSALCQDCCNAAAAGVKFINPQGSNTFLECDGANCYTGKCHPREVFNPVSRRCDLPPL